MPPPPPGQYTGGAVVAAPPNDSQATLSLILGILGLLCCQILAPVAFFIGQSSLTRIRASNGALGGAGLAQWGRILGIIGTIILALGILVVIGSILSSIGRQGG